VSERHHAEQALAHAHDLLRSVIDAQVDPHVIFRAVLDGEDGEIVDFIYEDVNEAAARFEGFPRDEIVGSTITRVYRTELEADEDVADCVQALTSGQPVVRNDSRTLGYLDPEGRPAFVDIRIVPVGGDRVSYTWRDITARHLAQEGLAESEERFRLLAENMSDVVGLVVDGRMSWISPSVSRALGWSPAELIGQNPLELVHEDDRAALGRAWSDLRGGLVPRRRFRLRGKDERYRWVDVEGSAIPGEPGHPRNYVLSTRIVDAEVAALSAIEDQARHDELTGLVNRHAVFEQLDRSLSGASRSGTRVAMVFCDLDGFKAVNDEFGHSAGDALLRAIARRLERTVRSGDVVARIGGDELLIILNGVHDLDGAVQIAEKLRATVALPTPVPGGTVTVSASVGVTLADEGESVDEIVARADAAMYEAKRRGKNTVVAFAVPGAR
jgi:diguanylate cyclase (GGDEF)-like protein/PAS domain S-box-containing protein